MELLFVCTGNMCRSAAAEVLVANKRTPGTPLVVRSAGTHARPGRRMHPLTAAAVQRWGIDADDFRSSPLTRDDLLRADLVLTMTGQHREDVLALAPQRMHSVYTLLEAASLVADMSGGTWAGPDPAQHRVELSAELSAARARHWSQRVEHDIVDPIDGPPELHQQVVTQIATALEPFLTMLDRALAPASSSGNRPGGNHRARDIVPRSEVPYAPGPDHRGAHHVGSDDIVRIQRLPPVPGPSRRTRR